MFYVYHIILLYLYTLKMSLHLYIINEYLSWQFKMYFFYRNKENKCYFILLH